MTRKAGHAWPAWFQDSVQHAQLLTNRTLRSYLLSHSTDRWPEVVKATLLYGVLCLQRDFPGQPVLELPQLHEASRRLHAEAALGAALPGIRSQFESLEASVGGFLAELDTNTSNNGNSGQALGGQQRQGAPRRGPNSSSVMRPSSNACTPATGVTSSVDSGVPKPRGRPAPPIYPDWWPKDAAAAAAAARRSSGGNKARPQPRLAYSRPPTAPADVAQDDLPTAAFLLVPPRLDSRTSRASSSGGPRGSSQQGGKLSAATSKVRLQHAQRLALQRQQQAEAQLELDLEQERVANLPLGAGASVQVVRHDRFGSAAESGQASGSADVSADRPAYDPALVAKWKQHFGL